MKDKQISSSGAEPRIPVISALLHCVSMTVLVYLRSSFGFVFLSPKSVFFAFSWAFALFTFYAWNEPEVWRAYRAVCLFGAGAAALYWLHLFGAFVRELYHKGEHDHYSGKSHPLRFLPSKGRRLSPQIEMNLHIWVEPAAVVLAGAVLLVLGERHLSTWLIFVALCLWFKEAFNYWHHLRQRKRQKDIFEDAGDTADAPASPDAIPEPPKASRKERVKRERNSAVPVDTLEETRAAEILRLLPPYSLEKAEENYRSLIKLDHPDANEGSEASTVRAVALNEAIKYFRDRPRE